jgi:hypothetical protein
VVAVAVAITIVGQRPARADEDLFRALAVVAGVAVVGKVLSDRAARDERREDKRKAKKKKAKAVATRRYDAAPYDSWRPVARPDWRYGQEYQRVEPRPLPRNVKRKLLPGDCLRSYKTWDGRQRVFSDRCLRENFAYARNLPRDCKVSFRVRGDLRRGYDARCLRDEGYQLARR